VSDARATDGGERGQFAEPESWDHRYAGVGGADLHYVAAGPEDGPLVVLLHGFPEFWYSWRGQIGPLADAGYRVLAPDLRGYNRSSKPSGVAAYDVAELVADVTGLIDHAGRESAAVVGHDWGGLVAWHVASRRPAAVDRLTVLNAPHPDRFERELRASPRQALRSWYVFLFQVPWLPERLLTADDCAAVASMLREGATRPDTFTDEDVARYREAFARPGVATAAVNYYRAQARRTVRESLSGRGQRHDVSVPTLLLWGEQDPALDASLTEGLGEWVPNLRVERYPDAGHWVQFDAPDRVAEALLSFLS
jgi:pimeloyl-ACP methyl ester carboxylesterase